jgi:hypothetical protein
LEVVMASANNDHPRRALIEVSPELADRLRDPRIVLGWVAAIAGAVAIFVGYLGVSDTLDPAKQLPYLISGGVGGLFLLGVGAALFFSADLGATRRDIAELRHLLEELTATREEPVDEPAPAPRAARTRQLAASKRAR